MSLPLPHAEPAEHATLEIADGTKSGPSPSNLMLEIFGKRCSGFSYILDLTETIKEGDEQWEYTFDIEGNSIDVRVICDPKSYLYLNGTTVDFKDEVMGRGFVFDNPKATNTCGCGSSFTA